MSAALGGFAVGVVAGVVVGGALGVVVASMCYVARYGR